ncbi:lysozyme inhibitor LprI family protein [Jeotgalibacillus sp. JSM ZJ347]|uniref:lysozyme inhibitor LprI family protein n=1 Tax=Jeotgalibacillus sp. JSM ZJ347 TaxID=3342117 RepID=UPI0035A91D9C
MGQSNSEKSEVSYFVVIGITTVASIIAVVFILHGFPERSADFYQGTPHSISESEIDEKELTVQLVRFEEKKEENETVTKEVKITPPSEPENKLSENQRVFDYYMNRLDETALQQEAIAESWASGNDHQVREGVYAELQVWDSLLNEIYGVLKNILSEEEFLVLRDSQRSWIEERDLAAAAAASEFAGGSWEDIMYYSESLNYTRERCYWFVMTYL